MTCGVCGSENGEGVRYCLNCGAELLAEEESAEVTEPPEPTSPPDVPLPPPPPEVPPPPSPTAGFDVPEPEPIPEPPTPEPLPEPPRLVIEPTLRAPAPYPAPTPLPVAAPPGGGGSTLGGGWGSAFFRGSLAFLIVALFALLVAVFNASTSPAGESPTDILRSGGFTLEVFHNVGIAADVPRLTLPASPDSPFSGPVEATFTFAFALMTGTLIAAWLLFRAGRATAQRAGGSPGARAFHGAKVALPYGLLVFGVSWLVSLDIPLPALPFLEAGPLTLAPSRITALLWPLGLALFFGVLGGLSSARSLLSSTARGRRASGMLAGAWRMTWLAMVLGFIGYLVVAALHPEDPYPLGPSFFRQVMDQDILAEGGSLLMFALLALPNIAALTLSGAAGGAIGFSGNFAGTSVSCDLVSYVSFPAGASTAAGGFALDPCAQLGVDFGLAPPLYFLFLLVPFLATILGGRFAARRAEAATRGQGATAGALAGVGFGIMAALLMVLATVSVGAQAADVGQSGSVAAGPTLPISALFALAWGVVGGALGGAMARSTKPASARPPEPSHEETALFPEPASTPASSGPAQEQPSEPPAPKAKQGSSRAPKPAKGYSGFESDAPPYRG